jgi:hypothetical protein
LDESGDTKMNQELDFRLKKMVKKPTIGVISKWLKPTGIKKDLEKMNDIEINRLAKKQVLLSRKGLVNMKNYYQSFKITKPGYNKQMEHKIHKEIFETEMLESKNNLQEIEELNESKMTVSGNTPSYTPPTKNGELLITPNSKSKKDKITTNSVVRYHYSKDKKPEKGSMTYEVKKRLQEIENLIMSSTMNFDGKKNVIEAVNHLRSTFGKETRGTEIIRTPEKSLSGYDLDKSLSATKSSKSCAEKIKRRPLISIQHNNSTHKYIKKPTTASRGPFNTKLEGTFFDKIEKFNKEKKQKIDLSFLANHNFSTDMITAFQQ